VRTARATGATRRPIQVRCLTGLARSEYQGGEAQYLEGHIYIEAIEVLRVKLLSHPFLLHLLRMPSLLGFGDSVGRSRIRRYPHKYSAHLSAVGNSIERCRPHPYPLQGQGSMRIRISRSRLVGHPEHSHL